MYLCQREREKHFRDISDKLKLLFFLVLTTFKVNFVRLHTIMTLLLYLINYIHFILITLTVVANSPVSILL